MGVRLSQLVRRDLDVDPEITGVTADSRKVRPGFLFAALAGANVDGAEFALRAVEAGAAAVLGGRCLSGLGVPMVVEADPRRAYALAAAGFYGRQPETCVAVTGTNGKTSVTSFCRQIFSRAGYAAASMGTLGLRVSRPDGQGADEQLTPPGLTTPDAADVASQLADLATSGVTHVALEASSHGIDQRRLDGVVLKAAGFLNLTRDHLDYHRTIDRYRKAKLRLFEALLPSGGTAVLNADSDAYQAFADVAEAAGQTVLSVGEAGRDIRITARKQTPGGQRLFLRVFGADHSVLMPLAGGFQASNAIVAAGLCLAGGVGTDDLLSAIERLEGAPGRMQRIGAARGGEAYVDYAHTPDGLATVLKALRAHARGRLVVVFGAGGDRDRAKRPIMGRIAGELADIAIVTDDNPRGEDAASIRAQVRAGWPDLIEIGDRRAAIRAGVGMLAQGDILVVAGKGHEQGQNFGSVTLRFDDIEETRSALAHANG